MISQSIRFHTFGKAEEVTQLEPVRLPDLQSGEVLVRMLVTPINPADLNFIQGNYGVRPELPDSPGIEGCGEVLESQAEGFEVGDKVIFIERVGTWQSHIVCDARKVLRIPSQIAPEQAAMLKVNPATAWRVLKGFEQLEAGDWVIQNAANSGVGQCLIQIAKQMGLHTINVVRRDGLEESLKALGGDHVLIDDAELVEKVRAICGEKLPRLASNAVGGDSALRQMDALGEYGTQVTFGAMSMRSLKVPNKFLIFKGISLRGLWITKWLAAAPREEVQQVYDQLAAWVIEGKLEQSIDTLYPPEKVSEALVHAQQGERGGKVLIDWRALA
ncbi:MDR family NADPH-dependent oxidoreductase [Rubritalea tangerina]|uniref:enoyl-[acyl-carrier-protein] reductase n=1 Tax=Rubritalea tangerina TaxID=430798 RepID=A0ABW4ZF41_9BACT